MKLILIQLSIVWAASCAFAAAQKEFRVSKVGADKSELISVFNAVNKSERKKISNFDGVEVAQRISETEFLVYPMSWEERILGASSSQRLGMGGHVNTSRYLKVDYSQMYFLETNEPKNIVDGEKIKDMSITVTDEIKEYRNVAGGQSSARKIIEIEKEIMSREEFVVRLRAGEAFLIKNHKEEMCRNCMGRGNLGKLRDNARCPDCRGIGKLKVDYKVIW